MALGTMTLVTFYKVANRRFRTYDVQLTSGANYQTGGSTVTPALAGMNRAIEGAFIHGIGRLTTDGTASRGVTMDFATTAGSVKLQVSTASTEVASNTDLSAYSLRITFTGQ